MSKGSSPRPFEVDHKTFSDNFDAIFGKKNKESITEKELNEIFDELYKEWMEDKNERSV
jgi:hypothetical protein